MNKQPTYYAILTAQVRYDNELKPMEKLLYAELTALSNKYGFCDAGNTYFAELYDVSKESISRYISHLEEKKYIKIEYDRRGAEIKERRIYITNDEIINRETVSNDRNINRSNDRIVKENNTSINNSVLVSSDTNITTENPIIKIENEYLKNYKELYEKGRFDTELPLFWNGEYSIRRRLIKGLLNTVTLEQVLTVLEKSKSNDWCVNELGYDIKKILAKNNFMSVYNSKKTNTGSKRFRSSTDCYANDIQKNISYENDGGEILPDGTIGF